MEAFHYRYHPVAQRMIDIVASRASSASCATWRPSMCIPLPMPKDIRYRLDLAGGATMDTGCYAIHMNRCVAGAEPTVVERARHRPPPSVDRWMRAELQLPGRRHAAR